MNIFSMGKSILSKKMLLVTDSNQGKLASQTSLKISKALQIFLNIIQKTYRLNFRKLNIMAKAQSDSLKVKMIGQKLENRAHNNDEFDILKYIEKYEIKFIGKYYKNL